MPDVICWLFSHLLLITLGTYGVASLEFDFDFWPTSDAHAVYTVQYAFSDGQGGVQFGGRKASRQATPTIICKHRTHVTDRLCVI